MSCLSLPVLGPLCQWSHDKVVWLSMSGTPENEVSSKVFTLFSKKQKMDPRGLNWSERSFKHCCSTTSSYIIVLWSLMCSGKMVYLRREGNSLAENPPPTTVCHWSFGFKDSESSTGYVELGTKFKRVERVATEGMIHLTPSIIVVFLFLKTSAFVQRRNQQWTCNDSRQSRSRTNKEI